MAATHCTSWHYVGVSPVGYWSCTGTSPGSDGTGTPGAPPRGTYYAGQEPGGDSSADDSGSSDDYSEPDADPSSGGGGPSYNRRSPDYGPEDSGAAPSLASVAPWLLGAAVIALGIAYFYEGP